jgi:hypothetical protein
MILRFHRDVETGLPHILGHGVTEAEVEELMRNRGYEFPGYEDSTVKMGQTNSGRYLKVIFSKDRIGDGIFIITAYEIHGKAKRAYRKRQRRKRK